MMDGIDTIGRFLATALAVLLTAGCATAPAAQPPPPVPAQTSPTVLHEYHPWEDGLVRDPVEKRGVCEKPSTAVLRPDAWLCEIRGGDPSDDGGLLDPCLAHPTEPKAACPEGQDTFYVVRLAAPLPVRSPPFAEVEPWLVVLTSGERCVARSGLDLSVPSRDGLKPTMTCYPPDPEKPSHFGDIAWGPIDRTHDVWTVRSAPIGDAPLEDATIAVAYR